METASSSKLNDSCQEIKLGKIKKFDGNADEFLGMLLATFEMNGYIYDTDCKKIIFALTNMEGGTAGPWRQIKLLGYFNRTNTGFPSWKDFQELMRTTFIAVDVHNVAQLSMEHLRQKTDEMVAQDNTKFRILASKTGIMDQEVLINYYA